MNKPTLRRAVYAGSFDPPTNGHLWMIRQAQAMFDEVIVAIGINPDKKSSYSVAERQAMLRDICAEFANVRVGTFENQFLVNYAHDQGAAFIIRGIRSAADYEYERSMRYINSDLHPEITTVLLMPPREFAEVSSTLVKGMVGPKGWRETIQRYLPDAVYQKILQENQDNS
ncbi:MAG: pantetheine-phosphate adenylyltransferase [Neisseria sp.]|nr:pantetheine-phosphate adenylyltransferase [Neisseria sp.]